MQFLRRIMCVLALAIGLVACSTVKLGYKALDDVGYWWLDGYFAFSDEQAGPVREDLDRLHAWHRTRELPRIAQLLERMEAIAPGPFSAAQACAFVPEFITRLQASVDHAEPALAGAARSMTPRQLQHLQRKYEENNRKFRKDWLDLPAAEQKDKRFKQALERLEMLYGSLDSAQKDVLRAAIDRSVFDLQRTLAERQRRQQDLVQVLRKLAGSQASAAEARFAVRGYIDRALQSPDPAHRAYQQALQDESCRTLADVHAATTPAQREHAARRLRGWRRDLLELAAQP